MSKWEIGYESYWCNVAYDPCADWHWRLGWLAAERDDTIYWAYGY